MFYRLNAASSSPPPTTPNEQTNLDPVSALAIATLAASARDYPLLFNYDVTLRQKLLPIVKMMENDPSLIRTFIENGGDDLSIFLNQLLNLHSNDLEDVPPQSELVEHRVFWKFIEAGAKISLHTLQSWMMSDPSTHSYRAFRYCLDRGLSVPTQKQPSFFLLCHLQDIQLLMDRGFDINSCLDDPKIGGTALVQIAIMYKECAMLTEIELQSEHINHYFNLELLARRQTHLLEKLVEKQKPFLDRAKALLSHGANPNITSRSCREKPSTFCDQNSELYCMLVESEARPRLPS